MGCTAVKGRASTWVATDEVPEVHENISTDKNVCDTPQSCGVTPSKELDSATFLIPSEPTGELPLCFGIFVKHDCTLRSRKTRLCLICLSFDGAPVIKEMAALLRHGSFDFIHPPTQSGYCRRQPSI